MSSSVKVFTVHNHEINAPCELELIENPEDEHIEYVEKKWSPILKEYHNRAVLSYRTLPEESWSHEAWEEIQTQYGAPDAHWNWAEKRASILEASQRMYALVARDSVEALMCLDLSAYSMIRKKPVTNIVYVDYLAVAPWNRAAIQQRPRFKGLGKIMLGVAVSISLEEEMDGRCGLHSLPQSEGFYTRVGMKDTGLLDKHHLKYFEFEPEAARIFLRD